MGLQQFTKEQLHEMSFIEVAYELLAEKKQAITFQEIMDEIKNILDLSDEQVKSKIAQFYTDLNIDGRFLCLGENRWGLRIWYPVDQVEEEIVTPVKTKKKKAKKVIEDDFDDFDDLDEDDDLGFDDIDDLDEDEDDLLEDDLDIDDDLDLDDELEDLDLDDDANLDDDELDLDDEDEGL